MKFVAKIVKLALAIGAVAGVIYLVAKYIGARKARKEMRRPDHELDEDVIEEVFAERAVEKAAEEIVIEEGTPIAEDTDFAE